MNVLAWDKVLEVYSNLPLEDTPDNRLKADKSRLCFEVLSSIVDLHLHLDSVVYPHDALDEVLLKIGNDVVNHKNCDSNADTLVLFTNLKVRMNVLYKLLDATDVVFSGKLPLLEMHLTELYNLWERDDGYSNELEDEDILLDIVGSEHAGHDW